ncbi:CPBP family intramembrane glutamic endopeptidase [Variovorax sp. VaC1]|uniref:CPBP family intramembrane glutamic endopeptidase n=1 Tax=Variovorax sp. VaC1 TaxID=3373132 RepID=UPI003748A04F
MPFLKRTAFPSAMQAVLLFAALLLCEFIAGAALRDANGLLGLDDLQIGVLSTVMGNGFVFVVVMNFQKLTYRRLFHRSRNSARATLMFVVPPTLLLVPALLLTITAVVNLMMRVVPPSAWEESLFSRLADGSIAAMLAVCVVAPVLEEMLFRGIVLRGFLRRYSRSQAMVMSALLFGAAHLNIYQFVVGFVLGMVLAWLYERTHSLIPCIALHATYNGTTLLLGDRLGVAPPSRLVWAIVAASAAAVCGLLALRAVLVPRATS